MSTPNQDTSREERIGAAQGAITAILQRYNCRIDASFVFARGQMTPQIFIEALPDANPQPAPLPEPDPEQNQ